MSRDKSISDQNENRTRDSPISGQLLSDALKFLEINVWTQW